MKHLSRLAFFSLLFLGACSQEKPVPPPAVPTHQEAAENETQGSSAQGLNENLTDPKIAAGEEVYEANCAGCHDSGTAGAPKPGNKEDWKGRLELGVELLTKKSIEGYEGKTGAMPAKGGNVALTSEEVSNAVKYMVFKTR